MNDMLPTFPTRVFPGQLNGPFHHRHEVWYPHGMHRGSQYMISTMAEDGRASSSAISLSIFDNIMMFGRNLLDWSKNGCK
ncbi:unnamed protein product [Thelazia callipaeda]|uniref:Penicillin-binding protein n=1 Tax=Thelazia callipaeda TaxID=103827 RepID=A0A0N5CY33_THECL|nr:unnamed protein product [Thelazia callipaeda]